MQQTCGHKYLCHTTDLLVTHFPLQTHQHNYQCYPPQTSHACENINQYFIPRNSLHNHQCHTLQTCGCKYLYQIPQSCGCKYACQIPQMRGSASDTADLWAQVLVSDTTDPQTQASASDTTDLWPHVSASGTAAWAKTYLIWSSLCSCVSGFLVRDASVGVGVAGET